MVTWQLSGDCLEVCNCEYLCPCIPSNRTARPTQGQCTTALSFHINNGCYGDLPLDDLSFVVVLRTPGPMAEGDWSVGVIIDERAAPEQRQALVSIARGEVGGPMGPVAALTSEFLGVESKPIHFQKDGLTRSLSVPGWLDQAAEGVPSPVKPGEPMYLDNTGHRANPRIALARANRNHIHAFNLDWVDDSGTNSSAFAPFEWGP